MKIRSLQCPHCGVVVAVSPAWVRGKGIIHHDPRQHILGLDQTPGDVSIEAVVDEGPRKWAICLCVNCGRPYSLVEESSKLQAVYPIQPRPVAQEVPQPIRAAFEDALLCMAARALGGCLLMGRTTLERMQRDKGVSSLQELRDKGEISDLLFGQADEVRRWANMVGHDPIPLEELTREDCEELADYIEAILDALYVQPAKLAKHRTTRQKFQKG